MAHILITGGCGFIGSNLAVALAQDGHQITCFDNLSRRGSEILLARVREHGCAFAHGDIRSVEDLMRLKGDFDVMIECSAEPSVLVGTQGADAVFMLNNNLVGSLNCFEMARQRGLGVLFLSTSRVYPFKPLNDLHFHEGDTRFEYNDSKPGVSAKGVAIDFPLDTEQPLAVWRDQAGLRGDFAGIQPAVRHALHHQPLRRDRGAVAVGQGDQGVFTYWLAQHVFGGALKYIGFGGKGKQVRDLLHVYDLVDLVRKQIALLPGKFRGQVFNAGGGAQTSLSLLETTALCRKITGQTLEVTPDPVDRPADVIWYVTDNGNTEPTFDWKPTRSPETILTDTYQWLTDA